MLDEATSAVDPATEVRLQRALDGLTRGPDGHRHRAPASTAEDADEVLVMDAGRFVRARAARGARRAGGRYAELHASWTAQRGPAG